VTRKIKLFFKRLVRSNIQSVQNLQLALLACFFAFLDLPSASCKFKQKGQEEAIKIVFL